MGSYGLLSGPGYCFKVHRMNNLECWASSICKMQMIFLPSDETELKASEQYFLTRFQLDYV